MERYYRLVTQEGLMERYYKLVTQEGLILYYKEVELLKVLSEMVIMEMISVRKEEYEREIRDIKIKKLLDE